MCAAVSAAGAAVSAANVPALLSVMMQPHKNGCYSAGKQCADKNGTCHRKHTFFCQE
jgi:hypothetical protein